MTTFLSIVHVFVCLFLILVVLLQVKGSGFGAALGGMSGGGVYRTKRGLSQEAFALTS